MPKSRFDGRFNSNRRVIGCDTFVHLCGGKANFSEKHLVPNIIWFELAKFRCQFRGFLVTTCAVEKCAVTILIPGVAFALIRRKLRQRKRCFKVGN